ncbi:RHS repeat domain-containing protein [Streptomyces sp. NPDC001890]|uniref:RHS repeat domain-containing protein n=1 Tax=Streptomyces sp. NPDC001890 TaxID=3364620 RepID=UPI00367E0A90
MTGVINPQGLEWHYEYDPAGRLISECDFDGRTVTYTYDAANRMTSRANNLGRTVRFEHNSLGKAAVRDIDGEVTTRWLQLLHAPTLGVA